MKIKLLLFVLFFSWYSFGQKTYTLITDNSQLESGSKYIVVGINSTVYYGMSNQTTNNRPTVSITVASGSTTVTPAVINTNITSPYEITLGGSTGFWTLYDPLNATYLKPRTGANNGLQGQAATTNATWQISVSGIGVASMICENTSTYPRNILRFNYNGGSPILACYASGQSDVYLYKEVPIGKTSNCTNCSWNDANTWLPVGVPSATDVVTIRATDIVYNPIAGLVRTAATNVNGGFQIQDGSWVDASATGAVNFTYGSASTLIFNSTSSYGVNNNDLFWPTSSGPFNVTVLQGGITLNSGANRVVSGLFQTAAGITLTSASLALNGTCQINGGGFFNQSPVFGNISTLKYNTIGTYGRGLEWIYNGVGTIGTTPGYPNHVQLSNNTTLNYNNGTPLNKAIAGNLTIDSGSSFYMDYGGGASGGVLTIAGNVVNNGTFKLGNAVGDDLIVGGSWTRTGTFNPNSRLVTFNGSSSQTINGDTTFDYLTINNASNVTLASPVTNNFTLNFTNGKLVLGNNNFTIGSGGTITNATSTKYVVTNGTGKLVKLGVGNVATVFPIGSTTSNYTPITLTNSTGTSDLSVAVKQSVTNAVSDPTKIVILEWGITSSAVTTATISPTWTVSNQAASFTNTGTGELGNFTSNYTTYPVTLSTTTTTAGVALQNGSNLIVVGNTGALNSPFLAITGTTTVHGSICPNTAATSQTYTITNSGRSSATGVTVVSNDPQFVVSALSSTTIAASGGTATYVVTFTPTSAGAKTATITVASLTSGSNSPTSGLTGTGAATVSPISTTSAATSIGVNGATLGASSSTFGICPNTTVKGFVYAINAVNNNPLNSGTGVTTTTVALGSAGSFTQGISSLASGTTYAYKAYLYDGVTYTYGSVQTFQTTVTAPSNVTNSNSCLLDNSGTISWSAPSTVPTGYMVFAVANTTAGTGSPTTANPDYATVNSDYSLATTYASLGKLLYKGTANSVAITGLTEDIVYSFRIFSYNEGGEIRSFSNGTTTGSKVENAAAQDDVKTFGATISTNQVTLNWTYNLPTSCFDQVLIVANQGAVVFAPSGDGSAYTGNDVYGSSNQVVYKGPVTVTSKAITGFTNGTEYCFKIFIRRGTQWSDGTPICATPDVTYCTSKGSTTDNTGITSVQFNTINQSSTGANAYTDFTSVTTTVSLGGNYPLTIHSNTDGNYTIYSKVWIDWNHDGTFSSGEDYELGTAKNVSNGSTSNSPLTIVVPPNAFVGNTRMRVSVKSESGQTYATPCENFNYGEVEDYTINVVQPVNAEINVKGGTIAIPNGFDAPYGLNNTLFDTTPLNTDSVEKTFTIENIGIANLLLTGSTIIEIEGANPLDFIVTQQATTPVINGSVVTFKIKFHPTVTGLRTANVRIESNDSDENPFIFAIEGRGICTVAPSITVFPTSGPRNTLVTFSSATSNLIGAIVTYNNASVPISYNSTDKIEVLVPNGANDGNFEIQLATGCSKTQAFDLIDSDLTNCEASGSGVGSPASDLIIYEVYDENGGSGGIITLYNRTGALVDLSSYSIKRAPNYGGTYMTTANLSGTIADGAVAVIGVSTSLCGYTPTGNGSFGVTGFNGNDGFRLMKGTTIIDDVHAPNYVGYYLKRKITNLNPNTTFNGSEWTDQSLVSGQCLSGVTTTPLIKFSPNVTLHPDYLVNCGITSTALTVAGSEGFSGGLTLSYQWYVIGISGSWTAIVNGGIYSGATSTSLTISNISGLDDYQFYCQIRESTATCYIATTATLIRISKKTWDGVTWSGDGLPPISSQKAIIDGDLTLPYTIGPTNYDKLEACECQVNAGKKLIVGNSTGSTPATLMIQGAFVNNGEVTIHNNSSLVQVNDNALNTGTYTGTKFEVKRNYTAGQYDYVYWGSPTALFTVASLPTSHRYQWNTTFDNTNGTQGNWIAPTTEMVPGVGYIARASNGSGTPILNSFTFTGKPNNGLITVPISRGNYYDDGVTMGLDYDAEPLNPNNLPTTRWDDNWNLLGNPYPSAINVLDFLTANTNIEGFVNIWTHSTPPNSDTDPYYQDFKYNYSDDDYISFNGTGIDSGPSGLVFDGFLASGQGFFVLMEDGATLTENVFFNNTMRWDVLNNLSYINSQFYRNANKLDNTKAQKHRIWLDIVSEKGQFDRTLVGYVQDATNKKDRLFDAVTKVSGLKLYSFTNDLPLQPLGIQGKQLPFDNEDVVRLGYSANANGNYKIAIASVDGLFDSRDQNIYLEDKLLGSIHDLRSTPYEFTSLKGRFDDRFFVRYNRNTLNIDDFAMANPLVITTNESQISIISKAEAFNHIQIFDLLGRKIYDKKDIDANVYTISDLVQDQVLIVKVKLKNGNEISNKIIIK